MRYVIHANPGIIHERRADRPVIVKDPVVNRIVLDGVIHQSLTVRGGIIEQALRVTT